MSAPTWSSVDEDTATEELLEFDQPEALRLRILERIIPQPSGCWQWQGVPVSNGYAGIKVHGRQAKASRVAYAVFVSPFPKRLHVCHHCDNRMCVNPAHLFVGTAADNMRDAGRKGRLSRPGTWGERHPHATVSDADVERALEMWRGGLSQKAVAQIFGVSQSTVSLWSKGATRARRVA